ncbi:hypothetical protein C8Q78DRAFT_991101 [Trametes maxima]|nr:hypothetical protein C8Q78DRAFT_991101 [Trametes maxima]
MPISFALKPVYYAAVRAVFGVGERGEQPRFDDFVVALLLMGFTPQVSGKQGIFAFEVPREWGVGEMGVVEVREPEEMGKWWSYEYINIVEQLEHILGWSERSFFEIPEGEECPDALYIPF